MSKSRVETQTNIPIAVLKTPIAGRLGERRSKRPIDQPETVERVARSIVVWRSGVETRLPLREDEKYTFGRAASCDIVFDDDRVSRQQGVLRFQNGRWWYFDFGSANGSLVGPASELRRIAGGDASATGFRRIEVGEPAVVRPGDAIVLGTRAAFFEIDGARAADASSRVGRQGRKRSTAALEFEQKLEVAARTDLPVFLLGASGSGKTHAARRIHERSGLKGHFVIINCARLTTDIGQLHSELLGHVKGGFTGAVGDRVGKLVHANGGTLFLDEVESLPDVAQGFLLDLLEGTGDIAAFGASPAKAALPPPRFRLISASKAALAASGLRRDLCERLAQGYMWKVPSLEDRRDDIPGLIETFLLEQRETRGIQATFSEDAIAFSVAQQWPGQVRELRAMVVALVQAANAGNDANGRAGEPVHIGITDVRARLREREEAFDGARALEDDESARPTWVVPVHGSQRAAHARAAAGENVAGVIPTNAVPALDSQRPIHPRALTREDVVAALRSAGGNKSAAARALGIARNTLAARMKLFGLSDH